MREAIAQGSALLWKDLLLELRSRDVFAGMLVFALVVVVVFNFAIDLRVESAEAVAPGIVWVAVLFAGVLGVGRTISVELDRGTLEGILLAPVDRGVIYVAKLGGNALYMLLMEAMIFPIFAALYDVPILKWELVPIAFLGTLGFSGVGTTFAAMAASSRSRELLLPVLLFPISVPVIIGSVQATAAMIAPSSAELPWLGLLAAFDAIFIVLGLLTFEYIMER